jgi:hypothetical protein
MLRTAMGRSASMVTGGVRRICVVCPMAIRAWLLFTVNSQEEQKNTIQAWVMSMSDKISKGCDEW